MRSAFAAGLLAIALAGLTGSSPSHAADPWPARPIRVIYPFGPGVGDLLVRPWADKLSQAMGQPFVVEYKVGASGAIAAEAVGKSAPDGYTLLAGTNPMFTILPHLRRVSYHWERDLQPVGILATQISGFVLANDVPAGSLKEVAALARSKPEELTCGSAGVGTILHIDCELFALRNNVKIRHIPYRGAAEAIQDLVDKRISLMAGTTAFPQAKAGLIKLIAVTDTQRHPDFPDVPTVTEAGMPWFGTPVWFAIFAPSATPADVMDKINAAMRRIAADDQELKSRLLAVGFRTQVQTREQLQTRRHEEYYKMEKDLKAANIRLD